MISEIKSSTNDEKIEKILEVIINDDYISKIIKNNHVIIFKMNPKDIKFILTHKQKVSYILNKYLKNKGLNTNNITFSYKKKLKIFYYLFLFFITSLLFTIIFVPLLIFVFKIKLYYILPIITASFLVLMLITFFMSPLYKLVIIIKNITFSENSNNYPYFIKNIETERPYSNLIKYNNNIKYYNFNTIQQN